MEEFKDDIVLDEENQQKEEKQTKEKKQESSNTDTKDQKIGEKINLTEFNFSKAAHPTACFFHVFFKV